MSRRKPSRSCAGDKLQSSRCSRGSTVAPANRPSLRSKADRDCPPREHRAQCPRGPLAALSAETASPPASIRERVAVPDEIEVTLWRIEQVHAAPAGAVEPASCVGLRLSRGPVAAWSSSSSGPGAWGARTALLFADLGCPQWTFIASSQTLDLNLDGIWPQRQDDTQFEKFRFLNTWRPSALAVLLPLIADLLGTGRTHLLAC